VANDQLPGATDARAGGPPLSLHWQRGVGHPLQGLNKGYAPDRAGRARARDVKVRRCDENFVTTGRSGIVGNQPLTQWLDPGAGGCAGRPTTQWLESGNQPPSRWNLSTSLSTVCEAFAVHAQAPSRAASAPPRLARLFSPQVSVEERESLAASQLAGRLASSGLTHNGRSKLVSATTAILAACHPTRAIRIAIFGCA
jgi:hypothetical protein